MVSGLAPLPLLSPTEYYACVCVCVCAHVHTQAQNKKAGPDQSRCRLLHYASLAGILCQSSLIVFLPTFLGAVFALGFASALMDVKALLTDTSKSLSCECVLLSLSDLRSSDQKTKKCQFGLVPVQYFDNLWLHKILTCQ